MIIILYKFPAHNFSLYFVHLRNFCIFCFSWQPVGPCALILKMLTFPKEILPICFLFVGIPVLNWLRKFKSLTQRYIDNLYCGKIEIEFYSLWKAWISCFICFLLFNFTIKNSTFG